MLSFKSIFFVISCSLSFLIYGQENFLNPHPQDVTYLLWDNQTLASSEDLLADPLLILRTSQRYSSQNDLTKAYQYLANLNFLSSKEDNLFQTISQTQSETTLLNESPSSYDENLTLSIANTLQDFVYSKPYFEVKTHLPCEKIQFQISHSADFSTVISTFDRIYSFTDTIYLSDLDETFLDHQIPYYFRARGGKNENWGPWTESFNFTVAKPNRVENLKIEPYQTSSMLFWEPVDHSHASYLIFGSNSIDFLPSIYSNTQPDAIIDNTIISSDCKNHLVTTQNTYFPINERYAYFRVITKIGNSLSKPSKLLPINDGLPAPERNALQLLHSSSSDIYRQLLPSSYEWMQKNLSHGTTISTHYVKNPYISEDLWNTLSPYFLPEHFPEKAALDRIFSKRRVLSSIKSLYKSGFNLLTEADDKIVVARHPDLKGYLIKAYTDEMNFPDWYWWKKRIVGMRAIQEKIVEYNFQGIMKAPKKWIYPLPPEPLAKKGASYPKNFILVVEEMDILNYKQNRKAYKKQMTPKILNAFYRMLTQLLLIDSVYADNTTFCRDGRLAFVDSEHSLDTTMPVPLSLVAQYLSPEMHAYWEQLIVNGEPIH